MKFTRRQFARFGGTLLAAPAILSGRGASAAGARVIVIGGGFGGATAARYIKSLDNALEVTLIEPAANFVTCPFSNLVLGGLKKMEDITHSYDGLAKMGIKVVRGAAENINTERRWVNMPGGEILKYDRLVVSPGIDFRWGEIEGYDRAAADVMPHAWKAGAQTVLLRKQLEEMKDGGTFLISPPGNPFRCPPGPGERISMVAQYFKKHKPKSKIIVLDPKGAFSKESLFAPAWEEHYPGMIDYRKTEEGRVVRADAKNRTLHTEFDEVKGDVVNFIPPQFAGSIARNSGLADDSGWCPVNQQSFASTLARDVFVIGDASVATPMPKSGFSANNQGKVAAAAIVSSLQGREISDPKLANTCYSMITQDQAVSVAAVYAFDKGKLHAVEGAGGLTPADASTDERRLEASYADGWYRSITTEMFG
jgi:NADPH-dependent 2,4-dienoyl-CoA reductase/sulfur reductase-like enzyme